MTLDAAGDARHSETCEYRFKPLPEGARFCPGCGTPVVDLAPRDDWVLEKRQATVLLCDLVNSVRIRETLGPEEYHLLLHSVLLSIRDAVYRFRSREHRRYDRTVGDSVLFCFGLPVAGERDAERAVEAALAARAAVESLRAPPGVTLALRIGVATGEVIAEMDPPPGDATIEVTGLAPNLAARLQECAPPGSIVLSDTTCQLVRPRFDCRDLGVAEIAGLGARRMWELVGPTQGDDSPRQSPFVGREPELATIRAAWTAAAKGGTAVVLLVGEPGVGKSRVLSEFTDARRSESGFVVTIRCADVHRHTPFQPVTAHIERAFRLPPAGMAAERRERLLEEFVHVRGQPREALPLLEELVTPGSRTAPPTGPDDARTRRNRTIDIVLDLLFSGRGAGSPAVIVVEDVHWADPSTLEILRRAVDREHPSGALFLLSARPEFDTSVLAGVDTRRVDIDPLTPAQSAILIARMDPMQRLTPAGVERIIARCDGIPLFLEQVMLSLHEAEDDARAIPLTLRDLLMSRLDRSRAGREVAQTGAAIGRTFSRDLLFAASLLHPNETERGLTDLLAAQLLTEIIGPAGRLYAFRHALIQDVAYDSLVRSMRRDLHGRIARALGDGRLAVEEATPEVIARHFTEAGLAEQAQHYWRIAAQQAAERSANVEAIRHFERAIEMVTRLSDDTAARAKELELRALLVPPMIAARGYAAPEVEHNITRARALFPFSPNTAHKFVFPRAECQWAIVRADYARAMDIATELTDLADSDSDSGFELDAALLRGLVEMYRGDLRAARERLTSCCNRYDADLHGAHALRQGVDIASAAPAYLSRTLWLLGETEEAERAASRAVELASHSPITLAETQASCMKMLLHLIGGNVDETRIWADRTAALAMRKGQVFWSRLVGIVSAWADTRTDRTPAAAQAIDRAIHDYLATGARLGLSWFLLLRADAESRCGNRRAALSTVEEVLAFVTVSEERYYLPEILRQKGELLALSRQDMGAAHAAFEASLAAARLQGAMAWQTRTLASIRNFTGHGSAVGQHREC